MKKNFVATMVVLAALAVAAGCKTKPEEAPPAPAPTTTTDTSGVDSSGVATEDAAGPSGELLSKRVVYFDLDRADIRADSQPVITAHAR